MATNFGITGSTGLFVPQTPRQESKTILRQKLRGANEIIADDQAAKNLEIKREFDATPITPSQAQQDIFSSAGLDSSSNGQPLVPPSPAAPAGVPQQQPLAPQVAPQPLSPSAPSRDALGISQAPVPTPGSRVAEIGNVTEQIADKMGLVGAEREKFIREESQVQATKEAKAGIGARTIIKSLKERGMSEEDIKDAIGVTDGMTKEEAMRGLSKLQKREDAKLSGTAGEQRAIDKINQAATYDPETGEPTNDAGIAEGFINDFLGAEADPDSDMTLGDYMTDSQKREFGRFKDRAARGRLKKDDIGRMTRFKEQAMKKAETKFARAQAKAQKAELNQARRNAKSAEQKTWLGAQTAEIKQIETQLKEYADASTKEKKELMSPEQRRAFLNRRGEITGSLANFNKNGVMDGAQTAQQAQPAQGQVATFENVNDAEAANLAVGTPVIIGGRQAVIR